MKCKIKAFCRLSEIFFISSNDQLSFPCSKKKIIKSSFLYSALFLLLIKKMGKYAQLNRVRQNVPYHRSSLRNGFKRKVSKQRGLGWFRKGYRFPATASRLNTILYENFYNDDEDPAPAGVKVVVYNRQRLFEQQSGMKGRVVMKNTGRLYNDDIRRGVLGEPIMPKLYEVYSKGRRPLEMPSLLERISRVFRASADGQDPLSGWSIEYKMPRFVKNYMCSQKFIKKVYTCGWDKHFKGDCEGYHERYGCEYEEIEVVCGPVDRCKKCIRGCCKQYWHQCQAQAHTIDAPGTVFVQLNSQDAIHELLGITYGDDRVDEYKKAVSEFCSRPWCDIRFPAGKTIYDYIQVILIPRNYSWFRKHIHEIWSFHQSVIAKREELGTTFEVFAEQNNIPLIEVETEETQG